MTRTRALLVAASLSTLSILAGCQAPAANATGENPGTISPGTNGGNASASAPTKAAANVDTSVVTEQELDAALRQSFGLEVLMKLLELRMAEDAAKAAGVSITQADLDREREITIANAFPNEDKDHYDQLLKQLLTQQKVSQADFDRLMRTNALLRAVIQPTIAKVITEDDLKKQFNADYGERVRVRHIALQNPQEVVEAKRRLAAGETFEKVAREMSASPRTARMGGELPPFSRNSDVGKAFTEAAFALEVDQVSEAVQQDGVYHLIKLEERIPPRGFRFEDYRDSVREKLILNLGTEKMIQLRQQLGRRAVEAVNITDEPLRKEFERRRADAQAASVDKTKVLDSLRQPTTAKATQPAIPAAVQSTAPTAPTTAPATQP
ncbi:MAG: peptidylprolyl isomerase [Tepidisphaeraceae bacterium]